MNNDGNGLANTSEEDIMRNKEGAADLNLPVTGIPSMTVDGRLPSGDYRSLVSAISRCMKSLK